MDERRHVGQRVIGVRFESNRHASEYLAEAYQNLISQEIATSIDSQLLKSVLQAPSEPVHSRLSLEIRP